MNKSIILTAALIGMVSASLSAVPQFRNRNGESRTSLEDFPIQELSSAETEGLLLMREEEKMAMDVYLALAQKWDAPIFRNIAASEKQHSEKVAELLARYELSDPIDEGSSPGIYSNAELSELYRSLVGRGSESLAEALNVGAEIERLDIRDLKRLLAETDNEDISHVYSNLLNGSERHLESFSRDRGRGRRRS